MVELIHKKTTKKVLLKNAKDYIVFLYDFIKTKYFAKNLDLQTYKQTDKDKKKRRERSKIVSIIISLYTTMAFIIH